MAREVSFYEVIVGNIGAVHKGNSKSAALKVYNSYVKASKSQYGRASGEDVSLWQDGDIIKEHYGEQRESNPGNLISRLKKGIRGHIKISKGRLIIKT